MYAQIFQGGTDSSNVNTFSIRQKLASFGGGLPFTLHKAGRLTDTTHPPIADHSSATGLSGVPKEIW
jgi:hypothetical protein